MKRTMLTLMRSRRLTHDTCELVLEGDTSALLRPGQFVELQLPGFFLRRPVSVCNWTEDGLLLLVRSVGEGTRMLAAAEPGTEFDALTGLGNGFDLSACGETPVLVGGGIGLAPLYGLACRLADRGLAPTVALGFRSEEDVFYAGEFGALGCRVFVATEDGSLGTRGNVTDLLPSFLPECDYAFACGPTPMLRAVSALAQLTGGQFSLEARMACGFGACMGCSVETRAGPRRVCKDGPVFRKEELIWQI